MPSPTTLKYSEIVTVDLEENPINFADAEVDGHRVQVGMAKEDFNTYFRWYRTSGQDRPVGYVNDIPGLQACLETSFSDGFTDLDSIATGLSYSSGTIFNPENVSGSMNDIVMAYVLFKVYGQSTYNTANKVYNATDALNMVANSDVSVSIGGSITAHNTRGDAIDQMFRDLLAADPGRFFDGAGNQLPGLFEVNADATGAGSWQIAENDIVQVILNFVFNAQVSRRVVSSQQQPLAGEGGVSGEQVTEEVIIAAGDTFKIRLQVKATATQSQRRIDQLAGGGGGGGNPIVPTIVNNVVTGFTGDRTVATTIDLSNTGVITIGSNAFRECSGLTSIILPNTVTSIDADAFTLCTGLTSITIPNSVTSLGNSAFSGTGLTSIIIPSSVTSIGESAFNWCAALTSVTLPNSISSIGNYLFSQCTSLTSITIPNSVTSISDSAFSSCTALTSITIPSSVTSIGNYVFTQCTALSSITIPSTVTSLGGGVFYGCTGLTSITLPPTITSINDETFYGCSGLTSITILGNVTSIGMNAFGDCVGLTSITIPSTVTSIGYGAFYNCIGLTSIVIPANVTSISENTFNQCTGLTSYTFNSTSVTFSVNVFISGATTRSLIYPAPQNSTFETAATNAGWTGTFTPTA